ncbi:MAG: hypothetical protein IJ358_00695 [Clostridia bacterium]|nr:hypothetical protein [Clostridia bacterium]
MKKWIGALCSALAGVLSLVFLSLPVFTVDMGTLGSEKTSGWKMLTDKTVGEADITAVTWYRIFAWILVVLAIVLIVMAVLQILANLNVIKMPAILTTINNFALLALVVVSILALVANYGIRSEQIDMVTDAFGKEAGKEAAKAYGVGASLWVVTVVNAIAAVCANVFAKKAD